MSGQMNRITIFDKEIFIIILQGRKTMGNNILIVDDAAFMRMMVKGYFDKRWL